MEKKPKKKDPKKKTSKKNVDKKILTEKQELFCLYFVKSLNATQSYKKAYECSYNVANAEGTRSLVNPSIREKITALKKEKAKSIMLSKDDIVDKYMKIAFADITDYVEFGREKIDVMTMFGSMEIKNKDTGETETVTKEINTLKFKDHSEVDGTIISQIKVSKDGSSVKLEDRMKALEWLGNYFILDPMSQHKMEFDKRKLEIEKEKLELEKIKANPPEVEVEDDGFVEALKHESKSLWGDEPDVGE